MYKLNYESVLSRFSSLAMSRICRAVSLVIEGYQHKVYLYEVGREKT